MMHVMYSGLLGTFGHTDMTSWMHTYSVYVVNIKIVTIHGYEKGFIQAWEVAQSIKSF